MNKEQAINDVLEMILRSANDPTASIKLILQLNELYEEAFNEGYKKAVEFNYEKP